MITRQLIDEVVRFNGETYPVASYYLDVGIDAQNGGKYKIAAKDLVKHVKQWAKNKHGVLTRDSEQMLLHDADTYMNRINELNILTGAHGHVVFACRGKGFWKECFLPAPVKNFVKIGMNPFVRILTNLFDQYKRYGICSVNRTKAVCADVYMNVVNSVEEMSEDVPQKVRYGGWQGYSEARIQRHVEEHVFEHLKHSAFFANEFFKNHPIERLIIQSPADLITEFEALLPEALARKTAARRAHDNITTNKKEILQVVEDIDKELRQQDEIKLVDNLSKQQKGGTVVTGLHDVLKAVESGAVNTLIVSEGFSEKGYRCAKCYHISLNGDICPLCEKPMVAESDIVDEVIEEAVKRGAHIVHVHNPDLFKRIDNIAAQLRFKSAL